MRQQVVTLKFDPALANGRASVMLPGRGFVLEPYAVGLPANTVDGAGLPPLVVQPDGQEWRQVVLLGARRVWLGEAFERLDCLGQAGQWLLTVLEQEEELLSGVPGHFERDGFGSRVTLAAQLAPPFTGTGSLRVGQDGALLTARGPAVLLARKLAFPTGGAVAGTYYVTDTNGTVSTTPPAALDVRAFSALLLTVRGGVDGAATSLQVFVESPVSEEAGAPTFLELGAGSTNQYASAAAAGLVQLGQGVSNVDATNMTARGLRVPFARLRYTIGGMTPVGATARLHLWGLP